MSDENAILAPNVAFYHAFASGDYDAMDAVWARRHPVACLHPGWGPVAGRDEVMKTWRAILANPGGTPVECIAPQVFPLGETAFVVCHEQLPQGTLIATNLFALEDGVWRMVHHQAGPGPAVSPARGKPVQAPGTRTLQ